MTGKEIEKGIMLGVLSFIGGLIAQKVYNNITGGRDDGTL